jgi:membrane-bound serine protease (ClpP class)
MAGKAHRAHLVRRVVAAGALAAGLALMLGGAAPDTAEKAAGAPPADRRIAAVLDIKGPIGPATSDYVVRGLARAQTMGAALVVLRMDTPGGLDTSMREIIQAIVASPVPVVSFVPSGGRAASAGTYISYASHIAAMAPGANLGAATPVQIGGGSPVPLPGRGDDDGDRSRLKDLMKKMQKPDAAEDDGGKDKPPEKGKTDGKKRAAPAPAHPSMEDKVLNDAVAYIRSLAQMRGRNVAWAEKAVREAASLSAGDALREGVIDLVAPDVKGLVERVDGRTVNVLGVERTLSAAGLRIVVLEPDWRSRALGVITNPNVAYLLLVIGIYGLIFEFYTPGLAGPGIIGAISLLLGLYSLHLLPLNYAGLALTLLGLALMVAEAFVPSFGIMGIGGIAAFIIGSIMLIDTDAPGFGISWLTIGALAAVSAGFCLLVLTFLARARKRAVVSGPEEMIGSTGRVVDWSGGEGHVRVHGELWTARAQGTLAPGGAVRVRRLDGLTLEVEPASATGASQGR